MLWLVAGWQRRWLEHIQEYDCYAGTCFLKVKKMTCMFGEWLMLLLCICSNDSWAQGVLCADPSQIPCQRNRRHTQGHVGIILCSFRWTNHMTGPMIWIKWDETLAHCKLFVSAAAVRWEPRRLEPGCGVWWALTWQSWQFVSEKNN